MDRSEWIYRAGSIALLLGLMVYLGLKLTPFDLAQRQGISFGLLMALCLRYLYSLVREGWDAAETSADGGFIVLTLVACALISTPY